MSLPVTQRFDVFLSYAGEHRAAVMEIAKALRKKEIEPWFDQWELIAGEEFQPALARGVWSSRNCAVFAGPNRVGPWQRQEYQLALSQSVKDPNFRVILVLLPGASRKDLEGDERFAFLLQRTIIQFKSIEDESALTRLVCAIRGIPLKDTPEQAVFQGECPYRGLEPFAEEHSRFFFGRQQLVAKLLARLDPSGPGRADRFLLITGDSGSGKSSLAHAGLMAAFGHNKSPGSATWPRCALVPGSNPIANLAVALWKHEAVRSGYSRTLPRLKDDLLTQPETLDLITRMVHDGRTKDWRFVILVDQFEEVFTECQDAVQRRAFIEALVHAGAGVADSCSLVLLTMRADFYGKCALYQPLKQAAQERQELVGPMSPEEIREAIVRPAQLVGCQFDSEGLVDALVRDVAGKPASLPLLQHALLELWERRVGNRLTYAAYKAIGGVEGALSHRAERVYKGLNPDAKQACQYVFLRLVQPGTGGIVTRRRVPREYLLADPARRAQVEAVIEQLTKADVRLLVVGQSETPTVEVAHEALFTNWERLGGWINEAREALAIRSRVAEQAAAWVTHQCDPDFLYRGKVLAETRQYLLKYVDYVDEGLRQFVAASLVQDLIEQRPEAVPDALRDLRAFIAWTVPVLRALLPGGGAAAKPLPIEHVSRVRLALLPEDESQLTELLNALYLVEPQEFLVLRGLLAPYRSQLTEKLWQVLKHKEAEADARLRAACALALFDPGSPDWSGVTAEVAQFLITGNPLGARVWIEALVPAATRPETGLLAAVRSWLLDESPRETVRGAALAFARFCAGQAGFLADAVSIATVKAFDVVYDSLSANPASLQEAVELLRRMAAERPTAALAHPRRVELGRRRAGAAIALIRLRAGPPLEIFETGEDPEALSQFIARARDRGVPPSALLEMIDQNADLRIRYALLLSLGKYPALEVPGVHDFEERVRRWFREENASGIHGACAWLLRQWGREEERLSPSQYPRAGRGGREWFLQPLEPEPLTMIVYPPGRFRMGSENLAVEAPVWARDETPAHWVTIRRPFALADRHVTRGQYERFLAALRDNPLLNRTLQTTVIARKFDTYDNPRQAAPAVNWYAAVLFCRWLTAEAGMMEADQCYPDPAELDLDADGFPKKWPLDASRSGYRLPTEAEWEYACRCGTQTSYSFGNDANLLRDYAWYVSNEARQSRTGGLKMPNFRGLFDMHGNLFDWCHDWYGPYPPEEQFDPEGPPQPQDSERAHTLRGGSYYNHESDCRSSARNLIPTARRYLLIGFRVACTVSSP